MFHLLQSLFSGRPFAAEIYVVIEVVSVLLMFIAVTLGVALFHPDPERRRGAKGILRMLLDAFMRKGPGR